jgi:hypothetical protein
MACNIFLMIPIINFIINTHKFLRLYVMQYNARIRGFTLLGIYISIYIRVCTYVRMCRYRRHECAFVCSFLCTYVCMRVCSCLYVLVCMCIFMYVLIYVECSKYECTYICTFVPKDHICICIYVKKYVFIHVCI